MDYETPSAPLRQDFGSFCAQASCSKIGIQCVLDRGEYVGTSAKVSIAGGRLLADGLLSWESLHTDPQDFGPGLLT